MSTTIRKLPVHTLIFSSNDHGKTAVMLKSGNRDTDHTIVIGVGETLEAAKADAIQALQDSVKFLEDFTPPVVTAPPEEGGLH